MRPELPEEFLKRIRSCIKDEYSDFVNSYDFAPKRGVRVNTLKVNPNEIISRAPFKMEPVPWLKNGFYVDENADPAGCAMYRAGVYYIQEPSAMTPADRLPIEIGDKVLDLCAAPGGKATALGAKLGGTGLLVANDASTSRCRALLHNIELAGVGNAIVTNEQPSRLEKKFPEYFDKIMVDAPCSGEGMFRKEPEVIHSWSPDRVAYFAAQQRSILKSTAAMLKSGGLMMYSTCTFSPEENEGSISYILNECPNLELVEIDDYEDFAEGRPEFGDGNEELRKAVRIWPHRMGGEGHFLALLRKRDADRNGAEDTDPRRANKKHKDSRGVYNKVFSRDERAVLGAFLKHLSFEVDTVCLENREGKVYLRPDAEIDLTGLRIIRNGLYIGELKKNRFEPSQALALYLKDGQFDNCISFNETDGRLDEYFAAGFVDLNDDESKCPDGIILVEAGGFPVGFGKKSGSRIKSRYLRLK